MSYQSHLPGPLPDLPLHLVQLHAELLAGDGGVAVAPCWPLALLLLLLLLGRLALAGLPRVAGLSTGLPLQQHGVTGSLELDATPQKGRGRRGGERKEVAMTLNQDVKKKRI